MPILHDKPPLLADANAKFANRRWTPVRVFAWTFLFASLCLWIAAQPGVQKVEDRLGEAVQDRLAQQAEATDAAEASGLRPRQ